MAANVKRSSWSASPHEVRFVCPRCCHEETAIVSASGELTPIRRVGSGATGRLTPGQHDP